MGGLAGHMSHIWEDLDLTFGDILNILSETTAGAIEATEKVDGINLFFTMGSDGWTRFARNGTDIKSGGMTQPKFAEIFSGHPAELQFTEGAEAISELCKASWWPLGFSRKNWVNCEILHAKSPQTIHYSNSGIVLHEAVGYGPSGTRLGIDLTTQFNKLVENIGGQSVNVNGDSWFGRGPIYIELPDLRGDGIFNEAESGLETILMASNLAWDNTVREFIGESLRRGSVGELSISPERKEWLIDAILEHEDARRIIDIKKGLPKGLASKVSALGVKKNRGKIWKESLRPLELIITRFGARYLKNIHSPLVDNPLVEMERLANAHMAAVTMVEMTQDGNEEIRTSIMADHQNKLEAAGFLPPAMEGIAFKFRSGTYKLTGSFSPFNQILGLVRYGRGALPPLADSKVMEEMIDGIELIRGMSII